MVPEDLSAGNVVNGNNDVSAAARVFMELHLGAIPNTTARASAATVSGTMFVTEK